MIKTEIIKDGSEFRFINVQVPDDPLRRNMCDGGCTLYDNPHETVQLLMSLYLETRQRILYDAAQYVMVREMAHISQSVQRWRLR